MTQDPQWGRRKPEGPPDLDELIRQFINKIKQFFGGRPSPTQQPSNGGSDNKAIAGGLGLVLGVVGLLWLSSGFYQVDAREQGVVLRFGRFVETTENGLRWRMPWPIEQHEIVKLSEVRSVEVGFQGNAKNRVLDESLMLTEDQNIVDMQLEVQYNVKDAKAFIFNNARQSDDPDARHIVKHVAETAIREIVGRNKVDFVLNEGRGQIAADVTRLIQNLLDQYNTGIRVSRVNINDVQPPEQVQEAFADAVKAGQDKVTYTNQGQAYAKDTIAKAKGTASRLLSEAEGYRQSIIANAEGDAGRFKQIATEYAKAPQVTRDRLYIDTMQQLMERSSKVLVDQKSGNGSLLYLPLDKLIQQATPAATNAPVAAAELPQSRLDIRPRADHSLRGEREGR